MQIIKGKKQLPRRTLLYGVHGVGKSTWAAQAPNCLFLNLEDGLNDLDCHRTGLLQNAASVNDALLYVEQQKHEYQYLAVDTVDWLEKIIHKQVAADESKNSIADIGYGKGYKLALAYWERLLVRFDYLRKERGMGIILLAHSQVKRFESPEHDAYDRYQPALHDSASSMLQEWCDEVFFANRRVFTRTEDQGFNRERTVAVGGEERFLRTQETAAVVAKNRLQMPPEIPFTWDAYADHFQAHPVAPEGNINGVVTDGSSKQA